MRLVCGLSDPRQIKRRSSRQGAVSKAIRSQLLGICAKNKAESAAGYGGHSWLSAPVYRLG